MIITLLHPSRSRPAKARETYQRWMAQASGKIEIEHILSLDFSDPMREEYDAIPFGENSTRLLSENTCVVEATNNAALIANGDILIYLSDDFDCPKDWDLAILEALAKNGRYNAEENHTCGNTCWLLKVDDCLQPFHVRVLTIPIMSKDLRLRLGYFWHPGYKSMFVDQDLYEVCHKNGWMIYAPDLKFEHKHCSVGKAERDETYIQSERNWNQGQEMFNRRQMEGFPV